MPVFFDGYYNTTRVLNTPATQNPATVTHFARINVGATAGVGAAGILGALGTAGTSTYAFPWTVTNNGTVQSTASAGVGVTLTSGGSVTNATFVGTAAYPPALIAATGVAVQITGGAGTVNNSATISQTGAGGGAPLTAGVFLGSSGRIGNTGAISSQATNGSGINLGNGSVTVVNGVSGSNVGLISGFGPGILGNNGASPSTITNYGRIQSTNAAGVQLISPGTVNNFGTITNQTSTAGGGVFLSAGGAVTNNAGGLIQGFQTAITINGTLAAALSNAGTVKAGGGTSSSVTGISISPAASTISNTGTVFVTASGAGGATGIRFNNGGTLINSGLVNAAYGFSTGVFSSSTAGAAVVNAGTILAATTLSGVGVNISRGSINNSGLISGSATGLSIGNGFATVNNTGSIVSTASGASTGSGISFGFNGGGSINNAGTISAATADNGSAINVSGTSGGTIVNSASGLITAYHIGIGFFLGTATSSALVVTNYGTIRTTQTGPAPVTGFNGFAIQTGSTAGPTTITNFGLVSGSQTAGGAGVLLASGGTVINKAGATINGAGGNAISVPGTSGPGLPITVINSGTLVSSSTANSLVYLGHGGSVTNLAGGRISDNGSTNAVSSPLDGGAITNSGMIFAAVGNGVRLGGAIGTVVNSGTIQSNGSAACGVYVLAGGAVTNSGLVQGADYGVHFINQVGTVVNSGSIISTTTGTSGRAVSLQAGGMVVNYGLISGTRNPVVISGVTAHAGAITISSGPGSVVNSGTIVSTNAAGNGINLNSGGTILNRAGGSISGSQNGIYVGGTLNVPTAGALGVINNYGTIASTGRNGISMVSGGTITNRGLITAYRNGIALSNAAGTIANFGTILHTGAGTSGDAVYLNAGGVVTNYGLISGAPAGPTTGTSGYPGAVDSHNQPITVFNLGTITNPNNSNGVNLLHGGTLVNGSPGATAAMISAPHGGVYMGGSLGNPYSGAVGYVTNYGTIINTGSEAQAIRLVSGGSVTNRGLISSGRTGISFGNTAGTLDNFGTVFSTASTSFTSGAGVYLQNGGQITNETGASITAQRAAVSLGGTTTTTANVLVTNSGALTGDVGIKIGLNDSANNTIVNFGTIIGTSGTAIDLGNDSASIVLEPDSSLSGGIANFHAGDSIDFPTVSAFSLSYANGTLTLFNQTTPVAQLAISTPYVNPQFNEAPDGSGGTVVTVAPPGGPVMFDFIYRYNGTGDYYYGKVADDGTFGYQVGQQIGTGAGTYTIFNEEPGAVSSAPGSVFVTYLSHSGLGENSTTPLKFAGGQPAGATGLGSESDSVIGTDGQPHAFGSGAPPSFPLDQLFGFIFSYPDGSTFYSGTVADDGSFGYDAVADGPGVKQIFDSSGNFQGYYTIYREGPTDQPAGKVAINRYFSGQTGQAYDVDQSMSGGSNGLGSETGVIIVNGQQITFGDPPEAVLPITNPALAVPVIDPADPAIAAAQIYEQILGRAPDSAGLVLYAGALANGASAADVQSMIAHSPEAQCDIDLMFQQVLGRNVDSSGLADYQNALAGGANLANLRALLGQSPEAQNDLNHLYRQVLGRDGDSGGLGSYASLIANGASVQDVRSILAHSGEAQNDLNLIYQQVLGRDGDTSGVANYQNALGSGWTLDGVRADILHSAEAQSDLSRLFTSILGRDPNTAELAGAESRLSQGGSLQELENDLSASGSAGGFTVLAAGAGDMALAALTGPTSFMFNNAAFGHDTILGFDPSQDAIALSRAQAPDFATLLADASQSGSDTLIALGHSQSLLLDGVSLSSLHPSNFQFV